MHTLQTMGHETDIEMVTRHVREGEIQIANQRALIAEMAARGSSTTEAEDLLATFEDIQRLHREHLARLVRTTR